MEPESRPQHAVCIDSKNKKKSYLVKKNKKNNKNSWCRHLIAYIRKTMGNKYRYGPVDTNIITQITHINCTHNYYYKTQLLLQNSITKLLKTKCLASSGRIN